MERVLISNIISNIIESVTSPVIGTRAEDVDYYIIVKAGNPIVKDGEPVIKSK